MLLRLDAVQHRAALRLTDWLAQNGLPIEVGALQVQHMNKIVLRDIHVITPHNDTAVSIPRITAHLSPFYMLKGEVRVNTLLIKEPAVRLWREREDTPLNIQALLDSIAGDGTSSDSPLPDIRINQVQLYDGRFTYDITSAPQTTPLFDPLHIDISGISLNMSLKKLSTDTLSLNVRSISGSEKSGIEIERISAKAHAGKKRMVIEGLGIEMPHSTITGDKLTIEYGKGHLDIDGEIDCKAISPTDFAAFHPTLASDLPILKANIILNGNKSRQKSTFSIGSSDNSIHANGTCNATGILDREKRSAEIILDKCHITGKAFAHLQTIISDSTKEADILKRIGDMELTGKANISNKAIDATLNLLTKSGSAVATIGIDKGENYTGNITAHNVDLEYLLQSSSFGRCNAELYTSGKIKDKQPEGTYAATITGFTFNEYEYAPITIEGIYSQKDFSALFGSNDENAAAAVKIKAHNNDKLEVEVKGSINAFNPHGLKLTDSESGTLSANIESNYKLHKDGKSLLDTRIYNIFIATPEEVHTLHNIFITDNNITDTRMLLVSSDILDVNIAGRYRYKAIAETFGNILHAHLPALHSSKKAANPQNEYSFKIDIKETAVASRFLGLPVSIAEPSTIVGSCDDNRKSFYTNALLNDITYNGSRYRSIEASAVATDNIITLDATVEKPHKQKKEYLYDQPDKDTKTVIHATAKENHISSNICWEQNTAATGEQLTASTRNEGKFECGITFDRSRKGSLDFNAEIKPSRIIHNGTSWELAPCTITGTDNKYTIGNLNLSSNKQFINIDGVIGKAEEDTLMLTLNDIKIDEILKLVNFTAVRFGGGTTGYLSLSRLLDIPQISTKISIDDFTFHEGYMGKLDFEGKWDEEKKAMLMHGDIYDVNDAHSVVNGFVSPANDTIHLHVAADRTRLSFLNSMLEGILSEVNSTITGDVYITGPLGEINLLGKCAAQGTMRLNVTNTTYNMLGDTIRLTHNRIGLENFAIADKDGHKGYITGSVNHNSLDNWTTSLNIRADNLLAYDESTFASNPFYGKVYVTGEANITANDKGLFLHANISNNANSLFVYDAGSIGGVTNSSFVTFTDNSKQRRINIEEKKRPAYSNAQSRLNLEFVVDVTQDMQLRVYTNVKTGDYIDLYGNGPIVAVYDEKEGFSMKGGLALERGTYKFTMQDIFPKEFDIIKGSTLVFDGNPFDAELNLKTKYLVPSASLSDLDPNGRRHKSVKVNCLMNISGKLESPHLEFDIELPDANEEQRELLASAINTPEQKNTQFIYLMGIGKFYTYDYNRNDGNTESSTAMESLISNTISGQLNNMLSQIIDNRNWNISGNFSSSERGWNSMEVEGILEGRLLDNRLLINGNFGYRENPMANTNFVGDFEVQWLLDKNGNVSLKAYNKTNDRYFSESTLTTQGAGVILRHDFNEWRWWLRNNKKEKKETETDI